MRFGEAAVALVQTFGKLHSVVARLPLEHTQATCPGVFTSTFSPSATHTLSQRQMFSDM